MKRSIIGYFLLVLSLPGCITEPGDSVDLPKQDYYVPVYQSKEAADIKILPPQILSQPGKIYVYGKYLLINEVGRGIHVYDNSKPELPKAVAFVQVLGNSDMAIRNGILYADQLGDLVALAFGDFESVTVSGRLPLASWHLGIPPPRNAYFECVDPALGLVVKWRVADIPQPDCYAF